MSDQKSTPAPLDSLEWVCLGCFSDDLGISEDWLRCARCGNRSANQWIRKTEITSAPTLAAENRKLKEENECIPELEAEVVRLKLLVIEQAVDGFGRGVESQDDEIETLTVQVAQLREIVKDTLEGLEGGRDFVLAMSPTKISSYDAKTQNVRDIFDATKPKP